MRAAAAAVCAALWRGAAAGPPPAPAPPLPAVGADAAQVSVSGISSGADFAVYFHVAHSASVMGAGVFAGNVYRCYTTRFPADELIGCAALPT